MQALKLTHTGFLALALAASGAAFAKDTPQQIIQNYMAAWNEHNPDKAATYLADDAVFYDVTVGTPQQGKIAARDNVMRVFIGAVPDLKWEMTSKPIIGKDGNIAFQWKFTGRNTGAWDADTPATGKSLSFEGVSFIRMQGDKIVYQGDYYDALNFNKQLGW